MCAWLGGWAMGEVRVISQLTGQSFNGTNSNQLPFPMMVFVLFWLIAWTIGGTAAIGIILYFIFGKEIITFTSEVVTIEKKVFSVGRTKRYAVYDIRYLRVLHQDNYGFKFFNFNRLSSGTLAFDYGIKTIRFAYEVDEAEAQIILHRIKEKYGSQIVL